MCSASSAKRCVLLKGWPTPPLRGTPASSFYRHKEGRCTCTGGHESRRLFPESRGCSGRALWGMAPGVAVILGIVLGLAEITPASWRLQRAAWSLLWEVPSSRSGVAAFRGSYRTGSCPGQGRSCFRGSCPCRSRAPWKREYEGGTGSWQHSSWSSAEHVLHCVAGSHSAATAPGSSDRSWRTLRSLPLWGVAA